MEFLTVGEFERTTKLLQEQIAEGFRVTHAKQDTTNGRIARLETDVDRLKGEAQRRSERTKWVAGIGGKVIATVVTTMLVGGATWWAIAYAAHRAVK